MEGTIGREWALGLPARGESAHKGTLGTLSILAGSRRYRGAAILAASAALRAGAGLVRVASTEPVCAAVAARLPEAILLPLTQGPTGCVAPGGAQILLAQKQSAILAGCGLSNARGIRVLIELLLGGASCPLVLDADALNVLAGHFEDGDDAEARASGLALLKNAGVPLILTPHLGEMARLAGKSPGEMAASLETVARDFAGEVGCTVVLKSHRTAVATPGGEVHVLDRPNPGLARGGSGDVLAGIIASLLAQGCGAEQAACAGVWLHSEAGFIAARRSSVTGLSPAELPGCLCEVWQALGR